MNAFPCLRRILFCFVLGCHAFSRAEAVTLAEGASQWEGSNFTFSVINGRPAVAWVAAAGTVVKYRRAADADGTAWDAPVTVSSAATSIAYGISLQTVSGTPAVCYYDQAGPAKGMKFVRAGDAAGNSWTAPVTIGTVAASPLIEMLHLEIIGGNPAILFDNAVELFLVRALNPAGETWGAPSLAGRVDGAISSSCLRMVDGRPAVAASSTGVWYARAIDAGGTAWEPVRRIGTVNTASSCSMEVVEGRPAIAVTSQQVPHPVFLRASDTAGTLWNPPVNLAGTVHEYWYASLAVIQGKPVIAYKDFDSEDLRLAAAVDAEGSSWNAGRTIADSGRPGNAVILREVNGQAAFVHFDPSRAALEYRRAQPGGPEGTPLWPTEFSLANGSGAKLAEGTTVDFGRVAPGTKKRLDFVLSNLIADSGGVVQSVTVSGPDAAEFHVEPPPDGFTLPGAGARPFSIEYAPLTTGLKTATFTITADSVPFSLSLTLTANSVPDISLTQTLSGAGVADGATLVFPALPEGGTQDFVFTVRNPGGANLILSATPIDGPDAGEFVLNPPPASTIVPSESSTFTLRYATATGGGKTATLHLVNNASGDKGSYDLTIRMISGDLDTGFTPASPPNMNPVCLALRGNGSILTGGFEFLSCFNSRGATDTSFFEPPIIGGTVECIAMQKDGRILAGGSFLLVGVRSRPGLARFGADGDLDVSFAPAPLPGVQCLAVQPDGKILAGGEDTTPVSGRVPFLVRLLPDGTRDSSFSASVNGAVSCLALQPDGKILIGGAFTTVNGTISTRLARLNANGTRDDFPFSLWVPVNALALRPDGRVIVGANYDAFNAVGGFTGFLANGTPDVAFQSLYPDNGNVRDLVLQTNGRCLAALTLAPDVTFPVERVARFMAGGARETTFNGDPGGGDAVRRIAQQANGEIVFLSFGGLLRRFHSEPASVLLMHDASSVRWMRGGASPEVRDVSFEVKPAGAASWEPLGNGVRVPGGWELTGLQLAALDSIRARGLAGGSLMESVTVPSLLEVWRQQYFHDPSGTGDAADDADPDHDGLSNFTEFAFGLSPVDRSSRDLPAFVSDTPFLRATFTAPEGRDAEVEYHAQWSPSMRAGEWDELPDTGEGGEHSFAAPGPAVIGRAFIRYWVKKR